MSKAENPQDHSLETLLTFPARFPIKAMGKNTPTFRQRVEQIIHDKIPPTDLIGVTEQLSKNEAFLSLTITAIFPDKAAIDAVYQALSSDPTVVMAL